MKKIGALKNDDAVLFSESEGLTESECDVASDSSLSEGTSSKNGLLLAEGKFKLNLHFNLTIW